MLQRRVLGPFLALILAIAWALGPVLGPLLLLAMALSSWIYRSYVSIAQREPQTVDRSILDDLERESPKKDGDSSSSSEPDDENTIRSCRRTSSTFENDPLHMLHVKDECSNDDRSNGIAMNSIDPVPFENDLFSGHVYFLVKTDPPHWKWNFLFNGRRRMFWIQVQGRFKKQPKGIVYLGGELPDRIALGFFTRSLASVIMSIIQTLVKAVHYAFGDAKELPHCAFPLYQSVDEMVITPENQIPPQLGQESFGESKQEHQRRMKTPLGTETYDLSATYTFHFHTMYVDLTQWKIINLPGMKDVPLTTFFEAHPLRLVCYDVVPGKQHAKALKDYVFCFSVTYTEPVAEFSVVERRTIDGSDDEVIVETDGRLTASATAVRPVQVPYWIEMLDFGLKKRSVIYMFACEDATSNSMTFKSVHSKALRKLVPFPLHIRSRLIRYKAIEAQRFQLQDLLPLASLILMDLNWTPYSATRLGVRINNSHRQSMIFQQESLRAVSDTFLRQEFLVLTKSDLHFYRTQSKCPAKSVSLDAIIEARSSNWLQCDISNMFAFEVETLYETLYIVVPSEQSRLECIHQLNACKPPRHVPTSLDHLQMMWTIHTSYLQADGSHRAVLNAKKFFRMEEETLSCTEVVENLLQSAISLNMLLQDTASVRKSLHAVADKVGNFLNTASLLRFVDLTTLETQESRLCFYLNVYQILLWHARIAYGTPLNAKQSLSFNRRMCYQLGTQKLVLSLAEIEHLILRAKLPPSALAPPMDKQTKALYVDIQNKYGLQHPDFRLSLVLYSIEPLVTFFDGEFVHEQLNAACAHMLQTSIQVNHATRTILLPKLCEWNRLDFGNANTNGIHCARKLTGFLQGELLSDMQALIEADTPFLVKYI